MREERTDMSWLIATADSHAGKPRVREQGFDIFDQIGAQIVKHEAVALLHGADWFESRTTIPVLVFNKLLDKLDQFFNDYEVDIYTVVGNHDCSLAKGDIGVSSLLAYSKLFDRFHVASPEQPRVYTIDSEDGKVALYMFGFHNNTEELYDNIRKFVGQHKPKKSYFNVAILHQATLASETPSSFVLDKGVDAEFLSKQFDFSIIGDNHKPQLLLDNVLIPGCPYPNTFADDSPRGIWGIEYGNGKLADVKFIELDNPKFISQEFKSIDDLRKLVHSGNKRDFYRIFTPDSQAAKAQALCAKAQNIKIVPVASRAKKRVATGKTPKQMIDAYVKYKNPEGLKKAGLILLGKELFEGME